MNMRREILNVCAKELAQAAEVSVRRGASIFELGFVMGQSLAATLSGHGATREKFIAMMLECWDTAHNGIDNGNCTVVRSDTLSAEAMKENAE